MTYSEAIKFLVGLGLFGTRFGLENTLELARRTGDPHEGLRFIHVAGTNGKGSTCAILESIYRANGQKTGLFTSPHLISFTERIQVNRICISEAEVARLTARIISTLGGEDISAWAFHPTLFEVATVMALLYFKEKACDIILWETGMGGRLDATNIVTPLASLITNVQYDHQQWLGNTLAEIAAEKAGIIKPRTPVITAAAAGPSLDVIRAIAIEKESPLSVVTPPVTLPFEVPLLGEHQKLNAAVALAAITAVNPHLPVAPAAIKSGLETVAWAGRLQVLHREGCEILLDGAHNPDGARTLARALTAHFPNRTITLILGLLGDKPWQEMCEILVPLAQRVLLVPLATERTADSAEVAEFCLKNWPSSPIENCESVAAAIEKALQKKQFVLIAGSLYLVGAAMEHLGLSSGGRSERFLNEWNAARAADR